MVRAVAAIGAMKARVAILSSQKSSSIKRVEKERKKVIDPRFPNAGIPWNDNDESMLREVLDLFRRRR